MAVQPVFPTYQSPERLLIGWLATEMGVRVVAETPANLATVVPLLQVTGIGGSDFTPTFDSCNVDVDSYAASRGESEDLSNRARQALMFTLPRTILGGVGGAVVASVRTIMRPTWTPYDDTDLRRFTASYAVVLHS